MSVVRVRSDFWKWLSEAVRPFLMDAIERPITDPLWKEKAIDRWIGRKEIKTLWFPDIVPGIGL